MGTSKPRAGRPKLEVMHPDAAGIDVGGSRHYVAVPNHAAEESVRALSVGRTMRSDALPLPAIPARTERSKP